MDPSGRSKPHGQGRDRSGHILILENSLVWTQLEGAWEGSSSGARVRVKPRVRFRVWSGVKIQPGVRIRAQIVIKDRDI